MYTKALSAPSLLLPLFLASSLLGSTVVIPPSSDTTLIQDAAGSLGNGSGTGIFVGRTNQPNDSNGNLIQIRRGLIYYNVASSVPAGSTITSVSLTMYSDAPGQNGDRTVTLHRVLQSWGEGASNSGSGAGVAAQNNDATWLYRFYNAASPTSSPAWSTAGGSYSPTVSASQLVLSAPNRPTWTDPQMVADVQSWLTTPANNFGWAIIGDESVPQTVKQFASREYTTSTSDQPLLTITYTPEPTGVALPALAAAGLLRRRRKAPHAR